MGFICGMVNLLGIWWIGGEFISGMPSELGTGLIGGGVMGKDHWE